MTEKLPNTKGTKEHNRVKYVEYIEEESFSLGEYREILRNNFLKIVVLSLVVGAVTLLYMFTKPNLYLASAVITPAEEENQSPAFGALASIGISFGGPTSLEDLESLFKSKDLTVRVFRKHNFWPVLLGERFDQKTGKIIPGWIDQLFGKSEPEEPSDWDAIRAADNYFVVYMKQKSGVIIISFESESPIESARIVGYYLKEAKSRLQEEAFARAANNKKFIEEQIGKTVDPLTRDRLYALYGQEVEREMMARNREQFGFRVIDAPRVPDRKHRPFRGIIALAVTMLTGFMISMIFILIYRSKH